MQFLEQLLNAGWHDLLGWTSIVAGLAVAAHALAFGRPKPGAAHIMRAYRPAEWSAWQSTHERIRPMDQVVQWERVAAIVERGFVQVEAIADLQVRAARELEAVDDGLIRLLAEYKPDAMRSIRQTKSLPAPAPAPAPSAEPLAA
jgi:hypothetical protein